MKDFIKTLGITKMVNGDVRWPDGPGGKIPPIGHPIPDVLVGVVIGVVVKSIIDHVWDWFTD